MGKANLQSDAARQRCGEKARCGERRQRAGHYDEGLAKMRKAMGICEEVNGRDECTWLTWTASSGPRSRPRECANGSSDAGVQDTMLEDQQSQ